MSSTEPLSDVSVSPNKRKRGRPRKADIEAKKSRGVVGRPPGEAARIKEFYARLLSTSGEKVIETVLRKAMDDTDKDQVACLKMCMDRLLPVMLPFMGILLRYDRLCPQQQSGRAF